MWSEREIELFKGMIEVQQNHVKRCDKIIESGNYKMATRQKLWDLERIALLTKCMNLFNEDIDKLSS